MAKTYLTGDRYWAELATAEKHNRECPGEKHMKLPSIDDVRDKYWMLTIGADEHSRDDVISTLADECTAAVFSFETGGKTGYRHYQLFAVWNGKATGHHVRELFGDAHCEPKREPGLTGVKKCVEYCTKSATHTGGPWWIGNPRAVRGMAPTGVQLEQHTRFDDLADAVDDGAGYFDLLNDPRWRSWAARNGRAVRDVIAARLYERFGKTERDISADYIWGEPGSGKTYSIFHLYDFPNIYIADLSSSFPFDTYAGQPVLLLDDFRSSLPYNELLRILDRYPLPLNTKGGHTIAGWSKVVISANIPIEDQYPNLTEKRGSLYRRFAHGIVFEKTDPDTPLPYSSREDAMLGRRNDGQPNGLPGWAPAWERTPEQEADAAIDDAFSAITL